MSTTWNGTPKPLVYRPDDSPRFHTEGWEEPDESGIWPLLVAVGFMAVVGVVAILRRIF